MSFTYYKGMECIIMGKRRNTKKYKQISLSPVVALLMHDFQHLKSEDKDNKADSTGDGQRSESKQTYDKSFSITLKGTVQVCEEGSTEEVFYRKIHLQKNPDYSNFIDPPEVAIFLVIINQARLCNVQDKVTYWDAKRDMQGN